MTAPFRAIGPALLALIPDYRCRGSGAVLVEVAKRLAKAEGGEVMFVHGDPGNYVRFGYSTKLAGGFDTTYAGKYSIAASVRRQNLPVSNW